MTDRTLRPLARPALWNSGRAKLGALMCASVAFMTGCATNGSQANPATQLNVSVTSSTAGLSWTHHPNSELIVRVGDFEGTNEKFSWSSAVLATTDRLPDFYSCLDGVRMNVRFTDPATTTQPHFIRSAVIHCFESSGMPAYTSTHEAESNEYDVQLTTGNLNDSTPREPGIQLFAAGGPVLGARRHVLTNATDSQTVNSDVTRCKDQAAAGGVFTTNRMSTAPDSSGWQMTNGYTTIQPLVDRFDQCLNSRGYRVEPAKK